MTALIYAPGTYWLLSPEDRAILTNGCGTKGLGGVLVPDKLFGLSITAACNIHDFMYNEGKSIADKEAADRSFLNNMLRIIEAESYNAIMVKIRSKSALQYYKAVRDFGGPAFWSGKNKEQELGRIV